MKKLFVCLMLLSVMLVPTALGESAEVVEPAPLEEYTITHSQSPTGVEVSADPLEAVFSINADTLKTYAWVNDGQLAGDILAVAVDIQGLNNGHAYKTEPETYNTYLGEHGVLVVRPYSGPWNWMSFDTIYEIDAILDAVYSRYDLVKDEIPLVLFGRSMGGIGVFNYAKYGKYTPVAVAANCPVTDLAYHATERPDCAATMYRAYSYYDCSVAQAIAVHNPMNWVGTLPDVPYFIVAGDADVSVNKEHHSDVFVPMMREAGYDVTYVEVPGMTHCDLAGNMDAWQLYADFITGFAK